MTVLPASASRSVLMTGMPPATAASKLSSTPFSSAMLGELDAMPGEQRLVGGDDVLAGVERRLAPRLAPARPSPPISSTKTSMSALGGQRDRIVEPVDAGEIDAAVARCGRGPKRRSTAIGAAALARRVRRPCRRSTRTTDAPTVPRPAMPMRNGFSHDAAMSLKASAVPAGVSVASSSGDDVVRLLRRRWRGTS